MSGGVRAAEDGHWNAEDEFYGYYGCDDAMLTTQKPRSVRPLLPLRRHCADGGHDIVMIDDVRADVDDYRRQHGSRVLRTAGSRHRCVGVDVLRVRGRGPRGVHGHAACGGVQRSAPAAGMADALSS